MVDTILQIAQGSHMLEFYEHGLVESIYYLSLVIRVCQVNRPTCIKKKRDRETDLCVPIGNTFLLLRG